MKLLQQQKKKSKGEEGNRRIINQAGEWEHCEQIHSELEFIKGKYNEMFMFISRQEIQT